MRLWMKQSRLPNSRHVPATAYVLACRLMGETAFRPTPTPHNGSSNQVSMLIPTRDSSLNKSTGPSWPLPVTGNSNLVLRVQKNMKWDGTLRISDKIKDMA